MDSVINAKPFVPGGAPVPTPPQQQMPGPDQSDPSAT